MIPPLLEKHTQYEKNLKWTPQWIQSFVVNCFIWLLLHKTNILILVRPGCLSIFLATQLEKEKFQPISRITQNTQKWSFSEL